MLEKKTCRVILEDKGKQLPCYISARTYRGLIKELGKSPSGWQLIRHNVVGGEMTPRPLALIKEADQNNLVCVRKKGDIL